MYKHTIHEMWQSETLAALQDFIRIPAKSTAFDKNWHENGYLMQALEQGKAWGEKHFPNGTFEIVQKEGCTPALLIDIPATSESSTKPALFYGHFDKQPECDAPGWKPWEPIVKDGRLYGRGSVDDGYSFYMALTAAHALDQHGIARPRITGIIETNEESGGHEVLDYFDQLVKKIGEPSFIGILDLSAGDFEHPWHTRSTRGCICLTINVQVTEQPLHSGMASGLYYDPMYIIRTLLNRIEDTKTGRIIIPELHGTMPEKFEAEMRKMAAAYDHGLAVKVTSNTIFSDRFESLKANTWDPTLTVIGLSGLPDIEHASSLLRPKVSVRISLRIPPNVDSHQAFKALEKTLTTDIPGQAKVTLSDLDYTSGFMSNEFDEKFESFVAQAANYAFKKPLQSVYCGASIGALRHFQACLPNTNFLNIGALASDSNAHAAFECLDLEYAEKLTNFIAKILEKLGKEENA